MNLMLTPLALAKPGTTKANEKFLNFMLEPSGATGDIMKAWEAGETSHARGAEWINGDTLTLTIGTDVFTMESDPVSIEYFVKSAEWDAGPKGTVVRVEETVTIYYGAVPLGTLELSIRSKTSANGYSGTVVGHGTGDFEGVKICAVDQVVLDPAFHLARIGTIQGWPGITPP
ncbi:MAG: hypothetical protein P8Y18_11825 [Candidatus Bathyarchaeota archaeon]